MNGIASRRSAGIGWNRGVASGGATDNGGRVTIQEAGNRIGEWRIRVLIDFCHAASHHGQDRSVHGQRSGAAARSKQSIAAKTGADCARIRPQRNAGNADSEESLAGAVCCRCPQGRAVQGEGYGLSRNQSAVGRLLQSGGQDCEERPKGAVAGETVNVEGPACAVMAMVAVAELFAGFGSTAAYSQCLLCCSVRRRSEGWRWSRPRL